MATGWVEMVHDATGGKGFVPNKPNVIAARREKGWRLASEPAPVADEKPSRPRPRQKPDEANGESLDEHTAS